MILSTLEDGVLTRREATPHFERSCDVLVMGAGSAGLYAADTAAREGASVILCELSGGVGGMHVAGHVTGYYFGMAGGASNEDREQMENDSLFLARSHSWICRRLTLNERLKESGVTVLCRHSATGLYFAGDRVVGALVFDGVREYAISAAVTVDATSDGHLLRMTDVKKQYGRPGDGSYAPFTVRTQYITPDGHYRSSNADSGLMDHYSATEYSAATIRAHAAAACFLDEGSFLNHAHQVGVREGLSFEGKETMCYRDVLHDHRPERILFWAYSDLDRHGSEHATDDELFQSFWVIANLATVTMRIPVPMGSVLPCGIRGLMTAGRCIAADSYLQSAVRMNLDMFRMGECVGVAAAMAARAGCEPDEIDYAAYLARVKERGCFESFLGRTFGFDNIYAAHLNKMKSLGREPNPRYNGLRPQDRIYEPLVFEVEANLPLLKTDAPGPAIWSLYLSPEREKMAERLAAMLGSAESDLHRYNCALALGLLGEGRAVATLREIVENRDCFFFTDNRRSNQFRSAAAICLLGRLGTEAELPLLFSLLEPDEIEKPMYHTLKANYLYHGVPDRNFVYFTMLTHTAVAICKIYERLALDRAPLRAYFEALFAGDTLLRRITDAAEGAPACKEYEAFTRHILTRLA